MSQESPMVSRSSRGFIRQVVKLYYPGVRVEGRENLPESGPILFLANHANSLIDPVIIGIATGRPVHYLAKAPLFDVPVFGRILHALGMIPAFRGSDDRSQVRRNLESLDTAARQLAEGHDLGIFPEGRSHDDLYVDQIRSGAARIALKAHALGAEDLAIVPIGINYARKERFRSGVWVRIGSAIALSELLEQNEGNEKRTIRALTERISDSLRDLVIHLDQPDWKPFLFDIENLLEESSSGAGEAIARLRRRKRIAEGINRFVGEHPEKSAALAGEISAHREALAAHGLDAGSCFFSQHPSAALAHVAGCVFKLTLGLVPAFLGTLHHLVPFVIVRLAASRFDHPGTVTKALNRLLLGLPVYAAWYALAWFWLARNLSATEATVWTLLMPFAGIFSLHYWWDARDALHTGFSMLRLRSQRSELQSILEKRRSLRQTLQRLEEQQPSPAQSSGTGTS